MRLYTNDVTFFSAVSRFEPLITRPFWSIKCLSLLNVTTKLSVAHTTDSKESLITEIISDSDLLTTLRDLTSFMYMTPKYRWKLILSFSLRGKGKEKQVCLSLIYFLHINPSRSFAVFSTISSHSLRNEPYIKFEDQEIFFPFSKCTSRFFLGKKET